jgi:hypothetical protein
MDIVKIGKAAPVESVVEELEKFLELAKSGRVRHVTAIFSMSDGSSVSLNVGEKDEMAILGHVTRMAHRMNVVLDQRAIDFDPDRKEDE